MRHTPIVAEAEQVLNVALTRWKHERDEPQPGEPELIAVHSISVCYCLLDFRIEAMFPTDTSKHTAPAPVSHWFVADTTLEVVPRPARPLSHDEILATLTATQTIRWVYDLKRFNGGDWLVMYDQNQVSTL